MPNKGPHQEAANMQPDEANRRDKGSQNHNQEYQKVYDDHEPLLNTDTSVEMEARNIMLRKYGEDMFAAYKETALRGEAPWID